MNGEFNRPAPPLVKHKSQYDPAVGEEFEWKGTTLQCVETKKGCSGCYFDSDMRMTIEHRIERAKACSRHFCEKNQREDHRDVKFVMSKM